MRRGAAIGVFLVMLASSGVVRAEGAAKNIAAERRLVGALQGEGRGDAPEAHAAMRHVASLYESICIFDIAADWWERLGHSSAPDADAALWRSITLDFLVDREERAVRNAQALSRRMRNDPVMVAELALEVGERLYNLGYDKQALRAIASVRLGSRLMPEEMTTRARTLASRIRTGSR